MKIAKEHKGTGSVDVDALLAAINEISESEVQRTQDDPHHVSIDGRVTIPGASWPRPLNSISMTLALPKLIADRCAKKIPTRRSRDETC